MSGLAGLLAQRGCRVSGSDNYDSYLVEAVRGQGIPVV
ncbi:MAG: Mur ligase domain-containing protein, partial [Firmicutes bacterium]|nr:Mur ligase domain-containing protein [Bacillota bacterium]